MDCQSVKQVLVDMLLDLSKEHYSSFLHRLLDRTDEPKVKRCMVEGKDHLEMAEFLISFYCIERAVEVAAQTLNAIGCNYQAQKIWTEGLKLEKKEAERTCTLESQMQSKSRK